MEFGQYISKMNQVIQKGLEEMNPVKTIKESNRFIYINMTGGGISSLAYLLMGGGASKVFIGARIPYAESELLDIIGAYDKAVSDTVANSLALEAKTHSHDIGIGVTCKLMTKNEREGRKHQVYMTISDKFRTINYSYEPEGLCRYEQEVLVGNWILDTLNKFIGEKEVEN